MSRTSRFADLTYRRSMGRADDSFEPDELAKLPLAETDHTPPVMWPEAGSGFEADPFSPAGMSQQIWRATGRRPRTRAGRWFVGIICVIIALAFIAAQVAH
jgi:hypothetical protein